MYLTKLRLNSDTWTVFQPASPFSFHDLSAIEFQGPPDTPQSEQCQHLLHSRCHLPPRAVPLPEPAYPAELRRLVMEETTMRRGDAAAAGRAGEELERTGSPGGRWILPRCLRLSRRQSGGIGADDGSVAQVGLAYNCVCQN